MSDYSSSSGSSTPFTLPDPVSVNVPISIPLDLTIEDIMELFPGAVPMEDMTPAEKELVPVDNTWQRIAKRVVGGFEMWILKKIGWLMIIEAIENGGETPPDGGY